MFYRSIVALLVFSATLEGATPVGLLSRVSGNVQMVRAGETTPVAARTADLIAAGDRVLTSDSAEAVFLYCPESRAARILPNSEVQFEATALQVRKGKLSEERKLPSCRLPADLALDEASQLRSGMLRLRGSNLLLRSPSRTSIATLQPQFRWSAVDHATLYELKLMDREERILWNQSAASPQLPYPADAVKLEWGQKYWWRVTARGGEEILTEAGSYFQVLPQEQAEQVRSSENDLRRMLRENPADNAPRFLLAFLYEDHGMLDEAARVYGELAQRIGPQDWIQAHLTELMNTLGWDKLESAPAP